MKTKYKYTVIYLKGGSVLYVLCDKDEIVSVWSNSVGNSLIAANVTLLSPEKYESMDNYSKDKIRVLIPCKNILFFEEKEINWEEEDDSSDE